MGALKEEELDLAQMIMSIEIVFLSLKWEENLQSCRRIHSIQKGLLQLMFLIIHLDQLKFKFKFWKMNMSTRHSTKEIML